VVATEVPAVLAYRTAGFGGSAGEYHVYANGKEIGDGLRRGAFFAYDADAGPLTVANRSKLNAVSGVAAAVIAVPTAGISLAAVAADASITHKSPNVTEVAGETHYMRLTSGAFSIKFREVPKGKGEKGIANCHWKNPPQGCDFMVAAVVRRRADPSKSSFVIPECPPLA